VLLVGLFDKAIIRNEKLHDDKDSRVITITINSFAKKPSPKSAFGEPPSLFSPRRRGLAQSHGLRYVIDRRKNALTRHGWGEGDPARIPRMSMGPFLDEELRASRLLY
jgi:hypothetical protein